ncbi:cs domain-containing protein [Cystoisospora suis]|uniref:Cs domain-containing protein n=1 Tax=Cystoisospora suis TaxID=483139 RepID=A0A2C6LCL1_9APIC|nr:cs domain-containing protein [Cystoisospora suis]
MTRRKSFRSSSPSSFYSFFFLFFFSSPFSLLLSLPYIYLFNSLHPVTATFFTVSFDSPSSSSSAPPNRGECSRIEDCLTEKDAVEVFKRNGENEDEETGEHRKEGHVSSGRVNEGGGGDQRKEQEEERRKKEEVSQKDVQLAIERGWWDLAKQIILKSHTHNVDLASTVRKSVGEVRTHLDELIRVLNKQHHEIQVYVHPPQTSSACVSMGSVACRGFSKHKVRLQMEQSRQVSPLPIKSSLDYSLRKQRSTCRKKRNEIDKPFTGRRRRRKKRRRSARSKSRRRESLIHSSVFLLLLLVLSALCRMYDCCFFFRDFLLCFLLNFCCLEERDVRG